MSRQQYFVSLFTAVLVILITGIVTVTVRETASSKPSKVNAVPSAAARLSASPSPSGSASDPAGATPSAGTPSASADSSAVPTAPAVAATHPTCGVGQGTGIVAGRTVTVDLPTRFPAPVIFDFHGGGQNSAQERSYTGLAGVGTRAGYVVVTPNGTNGLWNFTGTEQLPNDVAFTQTIAAMLVFAGCSNGTVYTAGISDGADMAILAACRIPEVRGVFAVAPSITPRGTCSRKPVLEVHGTSDPIVPYGGSAKGSFSDAPSEGVSTRFPFWTQGCTGPTLAASPGQGTSIQVWSCDGGRKAELASVAGGGHTWPGAVGPEPAAGLGTKATWSADALAVAFFGQQ